MPLAQCDSCGHCQTWRSYKGARLRNLECEKCGGSLKRITISQYIEITGQPPWRTGNPQSFRADEDVERILDLVGEYKKSQYINQSIREKHLRNES